MSVIPPGPHGSAPASFSNFSAIKGINIEHSFEELMDKTYASPLKATVASTVLGNTTFIENIKETHVRGRREEGIPALRQMKSRSTPDEIMQHINTILAGNEKLARQLGVYLSHRHSGLKLKEIGERFGMRESAICEATRRVMVKIERDSVLRKQVEIITAGLKI